MGVFPEEGKAVHAIEELESLSWKIEGVHSPIPSHAIAAALKLKKSRVGLFTLAGGALGFLAGYGLAVFTTVQWSIIVSGKPVVGLIPYVIVGFEFTILFGVIGNIVGLLSQMRLPSFETMRYYDPRCSGEHFGVVVSCDPSEQEEVLAFFQDHGGEVRVFEEQTAS